MSGNPRTAREGGAALVEALAGAAILALLAVAAVGPIAGGVGLLQRGAERSQQASVLLRSLERARSGQPVPPSLDGFPLESSARGVVPGQDLSVAQSGASSSCQGACTLPIDTLGQLAVVTVTVHPRVPGGTALAGATWTAP